MQELVGNSLFRNREIGNLMLTFRGETSRRGGELIP